MDSRLVDFRKKSSFFQNPASLDADLTLPPTNVHSGIVRKADDCGMKEWLTRSSPGAGFIGDPVQRLVGAQIFQCLLYASAAILSVR